MQLKDVTFGPSPEATQYHLEKVILDFGKGKSKSEDYWIIGKTCKPILSQYIAQL